MKIVLVDYSGVIPAVNYGGIERVIWGLGKELYKMGHDITYLVKSGSSSDFATVLELKPDVDFNTQIPEDTDIVHFSFNPHQELKKPYIITMHGNPSKVDKLDKNMVFISKNHAKRYNSEVFIYNGLDWDEYSTPPLDEKRSYLHFLGKATWKIKNVFGAIKIALQSDLPIYILGGNKWNYRIIKRGFKYIFHPKVHFKGMVDDESKMKLMKYSKGLVFPVTWHEPFGLAIIESLYAGCAVFGSENGALKELVIPEVGFISNNSKNISRAIREFDYNPKRCHTYAVENFNSKMMAESYLLLYKKIIKGETLNAEIPFYNENKNKVLKFEQ